MKLAKTQIILGALVVLIDGFAIYAAFTAHFGTLGPSGEVVDGLISPAVVATTRWAAITVLPLGLAIIACGIAQLKRTCLK